MFRIFRFGMVLVSLSALVAVGCGSDEESAEDVDEPTPGELLCTSIESSIQECTAKTPCDDALITDYADVVDVLSAPFIESTRACVEDKAGSPTGCLVKGMAGLAPTAAHKDLAAAFCSSCAFGAPGCEGVFFSSDGSEYDDGVMALAINGAFTTASGGSVLFQADTDAYQVSDDVTLIRGNHQLAFGMNTTY